ncbi:hypothetical protein GWI33_005376 [Rhynchophorus ferrugineus]|uniref:Uncharacterized protein n=1 Tax=Rhynchophorus ferrugineus TaxID=354439 RepID=A0A834IHL8_RHYFE|nr:hypothetical protein GWI33_005376 [Rhynchophorus ferrugineus]
MGPSFHSRHPSFDGNHPSCNNGRSLITGNPRRLLIASRLIQNNAPDFSPPPYNVIFSVHPLHPAVAGSSDTFNPPRGFSAVTLVILFGAVRFITGEVAGR